MKDTYYFRHDNNARSDPKLQAVIMEMGMAGIGMYWCIIEQLYEQGGELPLASVKSIAFALHVKADEVLRLINDFGLFEKDKDVFWSNSAKRRIQEMDDLSAKRSAAGIKGNKKRWGKSQSDNKNIANVSQSDGNATLRESPSIAIKEDKIKEDKIKEDKSEIFTHAREFLNQFFKKDNQKFISNLCYDLKTDMQTMWNTACMIVNEWCLTEQRHENYNDASRHLISLLQKKLQKGDRAAAEVKDDWREWEAAEAERRKKEREQNRINAISREQYERKRDKAN